MQRGNENRFGWILSFLLAAGFLFFGSTKLVGRANMVHEFARIGAGQWLRYVVGILELVGAVGILMRRFRFWAALQLAVVMLGATVTNLFVLHSETWRLTAGLLIVMLFLAWLRREDRHSVTLKMEKFSIGVGILIVSLALVVEALLLIPRHLPTPTGRQLIGRMEFDWTGDQNEVDAFLWYPATQSAATRAVYLREEWLKEVHNGFPSPTIRGVQTHAWQDAPVAISGDRTGWPVIIFSSAWGGLPIGYSSITEELASHGYVVAAPANSYGGQTVVFPDGRRSIARPFDRLAALPFWLGDISVVLKNLAICNSDPKSPLFQKLDLSRVGLVGHSYGGAVSAAFCASNEQCKAGVDMDGGVVGDVVHKGIQRPFLFLVSDGPPRWVTVWHDVTRTRETVFASAMEDWQSTCASSHQCEMEILDGFHHLNFTDMAALFSAPVGWGHPKLGHIGGEKGLEIVRQRLLQFFNHWLHNK